jgi:1,4-dihydroxy-2-naphthoate octaprenyltransferase
VALRSAVERIDALITAARPRTLVASVAPVAVGTAIAIRAGAADEVVAGAALLGAVAIQVGTNLVNDAADHARGADGDDRLGPPRMVSSGRMTSRAAYASASIAFAFAVAVGSFLVSAGGWPIAALGLASIAAGVAYTAGPWPLAYHGLGDLFVLVFFGGAAVVGTAFVQIGAAPAIAYLAAIPIGALGTAILVVNNVRDRVSDARAGKRTLVVRLGRTFGVVEYVVLVAIAYLVLPVIGGAAWVAFASLPLAARSAALVVRSDGRALDRALGATALLLLVHGSLLAVGIARGGAG